jgi:hypothetical protein
MNLVIDDIRNNASAMFHNFVSRCVVEEVTSSRPVKRARKVGSPDDTIYVDAPKTGDSPTEVIDFDAD